MHRRLIQVLEIAQAPTDRQPTLPEVTFLRLTVQVIREKRTALSSETGGSVETLTLATTTMVDLVWALMVTVIHRS